MARMSKEIKYLDSSKVQVRNQIVIPKKAADRMNLKQGDLVGFFEVPSNPEIVVITKVDVVLSNDQKKALQSL